MPSQSGWVIGAELSAAAVLVVGAATAPLGARTKVADAAVNAWVFTPAGAGGALESRCRYDLSQGPVRVTAEPWAGPMSLSIRAADGPVLLSADEGSAPQGVDVVLVLKGQAAPMGARRLLSPSRRGVVVDRRPAATPERAAAADRARRGNLCAPAGMDFPAVPKRIS